MARYGRAPKAKRPAKRKRPGASRLWTPWIKGETRRGCRPITLLTPAAADLSAHAVGDVVEVPKREAEALLAKPYLAREPTETDYARAHARRLQVLGEG